MEFVHKGNQLFIEENYEEACDQYTKAIAKLLGKSQFAALFGRARALMYLDKHDNAIRDFGECLSLDHTHQTTNYYLGLCLMKVGKHDIEKAKQSHKYLLIAQDGKSKQARFQKAVEKSIKLIQKLQPKVAISNENEQKNQTSEAVKKEDTDLEMKEDKVRKSMDISCEKQPSSAPPKITKPKIRESWYQSATNLTFTLYAKNLTKQDVAIKYNTKSVVIELKLKDGTTYTRNLALHGEIVADKCSFTMNKYKIILTLIKQTMGDWEHLEDEISDKQQKSNISAPWTTKKDWDKVDKFAAEELEKEKPDGDEALQSLFSKIYKDADDDQRRAMVKSFQTSGGTVLSTNWGDVKDKDYEGKDKVLPTGQDVAKWEY